MDWLWFLLWIVTFAVAMYYWRQWQEERNKPEYTYPDGKEAEFHRLYRRYIVARQRRYTEYLDAGETTAGTEFVFPSFAEWVEDRDEKDN
ncbi:hypothetical protein KDJ04_gp40 [Arthrobacter phage Nubia]|uniref:Uncharacterized protein n=1 Tax=Arthrobacter phage Nubia TaxID=2015865 RepID=A0A222ZGC1_9CAUD|nr:hypothetical protein KDJ04_gp40 [Arthrobacter phage Nubia]ASR83773.1 hypothetical protein SEA_NUBIA_40 [Arthrobacter phage Nubia]